MDIREYSYILAIINHGSISKAAKALFISQPSLSIYIKNLEKRLNISFFEKNERNSKLTPEGKIYVDYAQKIIRLNDDLYQQLFSMEQLKNRVVRIGVTTTRGSFILPKLMPVLRAAHPDIEVKFVEAISKDLEDMVLERELDLILVNYPFKEHDFEYIKLYDEEIVINMSQLNPIAEKAEYREGLRHWWIDIRELRSEQFILLKQGQKMRQIADLLFQQANMQPNILCETNSATTAYNLSCLGMGVAFVIDTYCEQLSNVNSSLLFSVGEPRLIHKFVLAYPYSSRLSSAAKVVSNTIKQCLQ